MPRVALLCPGLGRVFRGHETFARGLFDLLADDLDITLFKGGGASSPREHVIPHVPRDTPFLDDAHLPVSPKWRLAALGDELKGYELRKGTVHFPLDKPVPVQLISRIAKLRAEGITNSAKPAARQSKA